MRHTIKSLDRTIYWIAFDDVGKVGKEGISVREEGRVHYGETEPGQITESEKKNVLQFDNKDDWVKTLRSTFDINVKEAQEGGLLQPDDVTPDIPDHDVIMVPEIDHPVKFLEIDLPSMVPIPSEPVTPKLVSITAKRASRFERFKASWKKFWDFDWEVTEYGW